MQVLFAVTHLQILLFTERGQKYRYQDVHLLWTDRSVNKHDIMSLSQYLETGRVSFTQIWANSILHRVYPDIRKNIAFRVTSKSWVDASLYWGQIFSAYYCKFHHHQQIAQDAFNSLLMSATVDFEPQALFWTQIVTCQWLQVFSNSLQICYVCWCSIAPCHILQIKRF